MDKNFQIVLDRTLVNYVVQRKKIKNIYIRVKEDGIVYLSAPTNATYKRLEQTLQGQKDFILRALQKMAKKRERNKPHLLLDGELLPIWGIPHTVKLQKGGKRTAKAANGVLTLTLRDPASLDERLKCFAEFLHAEAVNGLTVFVAQRLPFFAPKPTKMPQLSFRTMTAHWGLCRPESGKVTLNRNLVYMPPHLGDYVVCHELAHFHYCGHGEDFWACLSGVLPNCRALRRELNAFELPKFAEKEKVTT